MSKQERLQRVLQVLDQANKPVTARVLARMLNTSERTIRTYISDLIEAGHTIESSPLGYTLSRRVHESKAYIIPDEENNERAIILIARLINSSVPLDIYSLADELYISDSTLQSMVLPHIRKIIEPFSLTLEVHQSILELHGSEKQKRRLLGSLATSQQKQYFTSDAIISKLFPQFNIEQIEHDLVEICQHSELLINDYALKNLLVHVMVIIGRIYMDYSLPTADIQTSTDELLCHMGQRKAIEKCAQEFANYIERELNVSLPQSDYQQVLILLALTAERISGDALTADQVAHIVGADFAAMLRELLESCSEYFGLPAFDDTITAQLTLHMFNAWQRATYQVNYPNPLGEQVKSEYAPVYDIAVHFVQRFNARMSTTLSENETSFVAFHIGSYLERVQHDKHKLRAIVVSSRYYSLSLHLLERLRQSLGDRLSVLGSMSATSFESQHPNCDVVIATEDVKSSDAFVIHIGPIANDATIAHIRKQLDCMHEQQKRNDQYILLKNLIDERLYFEAQVLTRNDNPLLFPKHEQAFACIDFLCKKAQALGFIGADFVEDVHKREAASSTAFVPLLAVPHALSVYAHRSFIAVLHTQEPIVWGERQVNYVMLIGVAAHEMEQFRQAFDAIIENFSNVDKAAKIVTSSSYDSFLYALCS